MTIAVQLYDTQTLLGVWREIPEPSSYFLDLCFPSTITFDQEFIDFEKIIDYRKLAPFIVPTSQGKPIFTERTALQRFKPAYIKPKDPVNPARMMKRRPGEMFSSAPLSPQQRFDAQVADILRTHNYAIHRTWEWLAAQAVLYGQVTISGEDYPTSLVDFSRDSGNTIVLSGSYWSDPAYDIMGDIESWRTTVRRAHFGGPTNRLTMGSSAWDAFRKNNSIKAERSTLLRAATANVPTIREGDLVEYVGTLVDGLELWVNSDYFVNADGSTTPYMDPRDVVLTGPQVQGVQCFGAILDRAASLQPLSIFPKMWNEDDPSVTTIMTQSAPLMVPVNPNNTLRARVLA